VRFFFAGFFATVFFVALGMLHLRPRGQLNTLSVALPGLSVYPATQTASKVISQFPIRRWKATRPLLRGAGEVHPHPLFCALPPIEMNLTEQTFDILYT
jgi:hypothetical protein